MYRRNAYLAILFLIGVGYNTLQAQKLDSLLKVLPTLHDSARIDCLNQISVQYIHKQIKDSVIYYADLCLAESKKINYFHGIAESFCPRAAAQNHFVPKDEKGAVAYANESLKWFALTGNKKNIEVAWFIAGAALFHQFLYDSSDRFMQHSYDWAEKNGSRDWMYNVCGFRYESYRDIGEYAKAFEAFEKTQQLNIKYQGGIDTLYENYSLAELNRRIGNYAAALNYYRLFIKSMDLNHENIWYRISYPELFALAGKLDSASYYYNQIDSAKLNTHELRFYLISKGELFLFQKEYKKALKNFLGGLMLHRQAEDFTQVNRALFDVAKSYDALKNGNEALVYAREGIDLSLRSHSKQYMRDGYQILYNIFERKNQPDSAFYYYRKFITQNELVANDNVKGKFAAYNYQQKIAQLDSEKKVQQVMLEKEALLKKILVIGMIGFLLAGFIFIRNVSLKKKYEANRREMAEHELELQKLESEKATAALKQQATDLEMQALRAQMNPHFIFNSLNSINKFILQNNKTDASVYLTKFSRLVRLILQNSQATLITLESELESLQLYLELEAVRFDHHFKYLINLEKDLDISAIKVPPLIIQPYTENAIWHGLMHKEEKGHLDIKLYQTDDFLCCAITDDGIGRSKATAIKSKSASTHKSMGMQITANRIAMLEQKKTVGSYITINDLVLPDGNAGGTEVLLKIPLIYD